MANDLYSTLGVARTASQDEIKKAYRKLAREFHPDKNPGDKQAEDRFKEVQNAYDVLGDVEKRQQYDTFGAFNGGRPGGGPWGAGGAGPEGIRFEGDFDLGDLFGGLFQGFGGGGRGAGAGARQQARRGADLEAEVRLSFEDALHGAEVKVPVQINDVCSTCHGSGARPGTSPITCPQCQGRGMISESQGMFALSQPCPRCRGAGQIIESPCSTCRGSGRERRTKRYTVKIPAGAKDGTRIRLKRKGEPGERGAPAGDLHVVTRVAASPRYERRGSDLVVELPVTYPEAALGATLEVETPDGPVSLKVPAGSEPGKLLRLKGRGAPKLNGSGRGDLLARVRLTVPKKLSKAEREALEAFRKVSRESPREEAL